MDCPGSHSTDATDAGPDSPSLGRDTGSAPADGGRDAGMFVPSCEPMRAALDPCGASCRAVLGAFWDGARCVSYCDECVGEDCGAYGTVEACQADHTSCDATLCRATDGDWFNVPTLCGHHECGLPRPADCEAPTRGCNCGTGRNFQPGVGCVVDPRCPIVEPIDNRQEACVATGGRWRNDGNCGDYECGRPSPLACVSPGCDCGPERSFGSYGCELRGACQERVAGESCDGAVVCGSGTVCCAVGGISTTQQCEVPMCDSPAGVCGLPRP